jgi:chondroitin-sulfate-ABC endolyase/exolyase
MIEDVDIIEHFKCGNSSDLYLSKKHFKFLKESIYWKFNNNEPLTYNKMLGYKPFIENNKDQMRSAFSIWIYNEKAIKDTLKFQFLKDENKCCEFEFGLNYCGWRTAWVIYDRDMEGQPIEGMNKINIIPPKSIATGELYITNMITASLIDPRHPTSDFQVPFVNPDTKSNGHWLDLLYFSKQYEKMDGICLKEEIEEINTISNRYNEYILETRKSYVTTCNLLKERYDKYKINYENNLIKGRSIDTAYYFAIIPLIDRDKFIIDSRTIKLQDTCTFLLELAISYHNIDNSQEKSCIRKMFINLVRHLLDQGFIEGSSLGTTHHLGYLIRYYYDAMFLMREYLKEEELLEIVRKTMAWYCGLNRVFVYSRLSTSDMDILNTLSQGMLGSILLIEDENIKAHYLNWFKKWIDYSLSPAKGLYGPLKKDGCIYHHCNHYPAYGLDGMKGITPVIYFLSRTKFSVSEEAHALMKKALLYMRLYSNKKNWLVSLCARHPKGKGQHTELSTIPFKYMALAGTPNGEMDVDEEIASAYIRLLSKEEKNKELKRFEANNIKEEKIPNGNWSMNYSCLSLHRRDEWLVGVKGHSRYLWSHESYVSANLYGRYITYGNIQILSQGDPITNEDSGYVTDGFDWNRWTGTTTIQLPFDELKSDVRNLDVYSGYEEMLLSDEAFAGALNIQNKQGMFAMKLHEHAKYDGSHRVNLSVFMFDNRIICLGSNIGNDDNLHETHTTLFQNNLKSMGNSICINGMDINELPYSESLNSNENMWLLDNVENGYYIPKGQQVDILRKEQYSKAQDTCEDTKGLFATAIINHSKAPKNSEYEYAIVIKATKSIMNEFTKKMSSSKPIYNVIKKDASAHIIRDNILNITAYALFGKNTSVNVGYLLGVDTPCMVMIKENEEKLIISVVDPDLRLYTGIEEDQYNSEGIQKEVSVYSRKWKSNESQSSELTIVIKDNWNIKGNDNKIKVLNDDNNTKIKIMCQDAMQIEFELNKSNNYR